MRFILHRDIFNSPYHFLCDTELNTFDKISELIDNVFIVDNSRNDLLDLYLYQYPQFPSSKFRKQFQIIQTNEQVPWHLVLPISFYKEEIKNYIKEQMQFFNKIDLFYYNNTYLPNKSIFNNLKPAKINKNKIYSYLSDNTDNQDKTQLKSFLPYNDFTEPVQYSQLLTVTGRLKHLENGPKILHLQKQYRDIIESRFGSNGKIYYLDYSSLEPRVLLSINGKENLNEDLYVQAIKELNIDSISRDIIKTATLSRIYGAAENTIISNLKSHTRFPQEIIEFIDDYFGINKLKTELNNQFIINDYRHIKNYYGRPIFCQDVDAYKLLNYYVQSTSVDVSLTGFNRIVNKIKIAELEDFIVPTFIIHDALVLDVHEKYEYLIPAICKTGSVKLNGFENVNFHLKVEKVV